MTNILKVLIIGLLVSGCVRTHKKPGGESFTVMRSEKYDTNADNLTGTIIDHYDKFMLEGAEIELISKETSYLKICDEKGEFKFETLPSGKYKFRSEFVGYKELSDSIEIKSGETLKLKIELGYDK